MKYCIETFISGNLVDLKNQMNEFLIFKKIVLQNVFYEHKIRKEEGVWLDVFSALIVYTPGEWDD